MHDGRFRPAHIGAVLAFAVGQPMPAQVPDSAALASIRAEGLGHSQAMETASWLTDVFGGRLTNSPAMRAAADWTQGRLGSWGITRIWRENWGPFGTGWTNDVVSVRAIAPQPFPVIANVEAWTAGTKGVVRGPAIWVPDLKTPADMERYRGKLRGAFVLLDSAPKIDPPPLEPFATRLSAQDLVIRSWPYPPQPPITPAERERRLRLNAPRQAAIDFRRTEVPRFLAAEGAVAIVAIGKGSGGTVFLGNFGEDQGSPDPAKRAPLPVLTFASEHYGRILRILGKGIPVTLEAEVRNTLSGGNDSSFNILAELPGTDPAAGVVMLGAHFDSFHFGTGATDNAVNVAVMMEAMRILKTTGVPLRRPVRLALWTGEEQGLLGSKAYVQRHFGDSLAPPRPGDAFPFMAYYNLDNGGGAIRGPMVDQNSQLSTELDSTFRVWTRALPGLGMDIVTPRGGGGTDHVSFYIRGLPGYQFMQDWLDYDTRTHHTNMDTFERLVPEDVRRNAVIVASFVFLTANRDRPMPKMRIW